MPKLAERIIDFLRQNKKQLSFFWRYALQAKLHFSKYASRKVILFRLDLIGDCTMFTSAAKAIREFYQDREMTLVCLSSTKPLFERLGVFDKIIGVDFSPHNVDFQKLPALIQELRKDKYDLLLQPQVSKCPLADILAAAVRCNRRIAIETKSGNSSEKWVRMVNFLYDHVIPYPQDQVSEFDCYAAFVRGIGYEGYRITRPSLPFEEQHFIEGNYYVLYPGGSMSQKFWPAERFAQLADYIFRRTGLLGVILGTGKEQWVSDQVKKNLNIQTSMAMVDLTGSTSITDVIDIIGNAKFVVSNDTSGVHIACATNTPSVSNVGGWHFGRFLPYHIEDVRPGDNLPLVAYVEMPCYLCGWDWNIVGPQNPGCLHHLQYGEPCECVDKVTFGQMRDLVDQVMEECKLC